MRGAEDEAVGLAGPADEEALLVQLVQDFELGLAGLVDFEVDVAAEGFEDYFGVRFEPDLVERDPVRGRVEMGVNPRDARELFISRIFGLHFLKYRPY